MNSRIYILAIALMTGVGAMAQNTQQNSNVEKIEKYTVQTNLFGYRPTCLATTCL